MSIMNLPVNELSIAHTKSSLFFSCLSQTAADKKSKSECFASRRSHRCKRHEALTWVDDGPTIRGRGEDELDVEGGDRWLLSC